METFKIGSLYCVKKDVRLFDSSAHAFGGFLIDVPKNSNLLLVARDLEAAGPFNDGTYGIRWAKTFYFDNKTIDDTTETLTNPDDYFEEIKTDGI